MKKLYLSLVVILFLIINPSFAQHKVAISDEIKKAHLVVLINCLAKVL